jgi:hypothetical protein
MAAIASITVSDGQATPVATNFLPESSTPDKSAWVDRTSGIMALFRRLTVSLRMPSKSEVVARAVFTTDYPVSEVVNGITTVGYVLRARTEYILPQKSTDADRRNLHAFHVNALSGVTAVTKAMRDYEPVY